MLVALTNPSDCWRLSWATTACYVVTRPRAGYSKSRVSIPRKREKIDCSLKCPNPLWGPPSLLGATQSPIQCVLGLLSLDVKQLERKTDYSPPYSVEVKKKWSYSRTPPIGLCGVHRDNFTSCCPFFFGLIARFHSGSSGYCVK